MEQTAINTAINNAIRDHALMPFLKSFWAIFPEPDDSAKYETWEESWAELLIYLRDEHLHRFTLEEIEQELHDILQTTK